MNLIFNRTPARILLLVPCCFRVLSNFALAGDWPFKADAEIFSVPCLDDNCLFFGDCAGSFYCVDKASGEQRWKRSGLVRVDSDPTLCGTDVIVCSVDDRVHALNRKTGEVSWEVRLEGCGTANPKAREDSILIPCKGRIVELSARTGAVRRSLGVTGQVGNIAWNSRFLFSAVISDSARDDYTGSGELVAFDLKTGKVAWTHAAGGTCYGSISCDESNCYAGFRDAQFYAVDASTGKKRWQFDCGTILSPRTLSRVWADGHVELTRDFLVFSANHQAIEDPSALVAVQRASGKTLWTAHHDAEICGKFVIVDDVVVAVTQDRKVLGINIESGKTVFTRELPKDERGEFAGTVADGRVLFIVGADAKVWRIPLGSLVHPKQ